jgi:hypothetical protein
LEAYVEEWMTLCKQAAQEQDPAKLLSLVKRINALLERKYQRLEDAPVPSAQE